MVPVGDEQPLDVVRSKLAAPLEEMEYLELSPEVTEPLNEACRETRRSWACTGRVGIDGRGLVGMGGLAAGYRL